MANLLSQALNTIKHPHRNPTTPLPIGPSRAPSFSRFGRRETVFAWATSHGSASSCALHTQAACVKHATMLAPTVRIFAKWAAPPTSRTSHAACLTQVVPTHPADLLHPCRSGIWKWRPRPAQRAGAA
jgi:hypothetical protein